ncbi:MAG: rhomboid family intramembrane serine protease [Actinomycetaceae bacterium]|nr:rhomboid family intramembrane serine protease [Actinomycetaceae bacterium]
MSRPPHPDSWRNIVRDATRLGASRFAAPLVVVALMWVTFLAQQFFDPWIWGTFGIEQGVWLRPWTWVTSVFPHANLRHLLSNTPFMLILGLIVGAEGWRRWLGVTIWGLLGAGLLVTLLAPMNSITAGASGLVFTYFGYLIAVAITERTWRVKVLRIVVAAVLLSSYSYVIFSGFVSSGNMSWQGHLGGFLGGIAAAVIFEAREPESTLEARSRLHP